MDWFTLTVLDSTLELAEDVMAADEVDQYIRTIRDYLPPVAVDSQSRENMEKLRQALLDLAERATEAKQFLVAVRLRHIALQLQLPAAA